MRIGKGENRTEIVDKGFNLSLSYIGPSNICFLLIPVKVTNCTDLSEFLFISDDSHFMLQTDGTLVVS